MAIVHMKKLRLMVVRGQKDALLRDLMLLGCVQVSEPDALLADAEAAAVLRQESGNVTETRSELTRLNAALKLLDKYAPVKSKLLSSRPEVTEREFLDVGAYRKELDAVAQLEELEADVRRYNGEEAKLRSSVEALRPWETLDLPLSLGSTRITLGMLPAAADLGEAQKALAEAAPESQMYEISADREQHYVLLICMKDELTEALAALRTFGFTLANLGGTPGTAKQNIDTAQQQIADAIRKREQAEADIAAFAPHRDAFKLCVDRASVRLARRASCVCAAGSRRRRRKSSRRCSQSMTAHGIWPTPRRMNIPRCRSSSRTTSSQSRSTWSRTCTVCRPTARWTRTRSWRRFSSCFTAS